MSDLLPCPFCGCQLVVRHTGWFDHPKRKCILSGKAFHKGFIGQWNNRADLPPTLSAALKLPEIRALVEAVELLGFRRLVAGWNGEGLEIPYTPHEPRLGVRLSVTAGTVYAIDAALAAIKEPKP